EPRSGPPTPPREYHRPKTQQPSNTVHGDPPALWSTLLRRRGLCKGRSRRPDALPVNNRRARIPCIPPRDTVETVERIKFAALTDAQHSRIVCSNVNT